MNENRSSLVVGLSGLKRTEQEERRGKNEIFTTKTFAFISFSKFKLNYRSILYYNGHLFLYEKKLKKNAY